MKELACDVIDSSNEFNGNKDYNSSQSQWLLNEKYITLDGCCPMCILAAPGALD